MKNKKGFTLVELLGVIVILSMIVLVTVPAVITSLTNSEEKNKAEYEKTVFLAAESYFQNNSESFPQLYSGGKAFVQVSTLIEEGYIKETLVNPSTGEKIDSTVSIGATMNGDGTFDYSIETLNLSYQAYANTGLVLMYDGIQQIYGGKLEDLSSRGYDGVFNGLDDNSGWRGNHILFDGKNDNVNQAVPISGDFTVEFVIGNELKLNGSTQYGGIISANKWDTSEDAVNPAMMVFYDERSVKSINFRFLAPADLNRPYAEISMGNTLITALKNKNTFTVIKTGKSIKVYFNNVLVGSSTDAAFINRFDVTSLDLTIGSWENAFTQFDLYNLRVYNKALTEEERVENYQLDLSRF